MSGDKQAAHTEREAARWIARLEASDVTLDDHRRFRRWLAGPPENRTAYEALARTWDKLDALRYLDVANDLPEAPARSRRWLITAGAGGALAAAGAAALFVLRPGSSEAAVFETPVGGRQTVTLDDASTVDLNAATRIAVEYAADERRVTMERGEALFDVRPDPARPFRVITPFGDIRVIGTSFSLKLMPDGARATVLRGEVEAAARRGSATATAHANEEIALSAEAVSATALNSEASERRLAWRDGMLSFDGETLREAALDVERQTGVRFVFAEPSIGDLRVGGYIDARDADAFIALLQNNLRLTAERVGDGDVVLSQ
jgi:transmembrane sensor